MWARMGLAWMLLLAGVAVLAGAGAAWAEPGAHAGLPGKKPGAPLVVEVEVEERAAPGGRFVLQATVAPLAEAGAVRLSWRGSKGISFPGGAAGEHLAAADEAPVEVELEGTWDGTLPGRVYLVSEWLEGERRHVRTVAVSVIDAASEARLTRPAEPDGVRVLGSDRPE